MHLIIVSGLSGSGKSIVLAALEDCGYYCIDNLPVVLLEPFAQQAMQVGQTTYQKTAIAVDSRNQTNDFAGVGRSVEALRKAGLEVDVLFFQATEAALFQRFSETRRRHPLTFEGRSLAEAMATERIMLEPLATCASLVVDTTHTNVHQLRDLVREWVGMAPNLLLSVCFLSFGFKHGVPLDADFVFDARSLPNPHWESSMRNLTGRDALVQEFLCSSPEVGEFLADLQNFLQRWLPRFERENRSYLNIAVGCTGGQHRSVFLVEALATNFSASPYRILVRHRELR